MAVTDPWPRNAAAIPTSSDDAGACPISPPAPVGFARRAAVAGQGLAPMTGASSALAAGVAWRRRRLSPTISPTDVRPDRRQFAAEVLGDRGEEADHVVGRAGELGPQVVALGGDPGRTGIEVALAGHVAADRDERRRPEREFLRPEERRDDQVAPGLEPAVGAQHDPIAQVVAQQDLVDLGQAELPRRPDVLDRRERRGAGPAGVAGQVDVRGAGLGDARGDRPDPAAGDELHADARQRVDGPQVGDQLGEVLDRVDVVVGRRADVALAGLAAAECGDVGRRLAPGELPALAGLGALGDLDLELVGPGEVRGGHPEPCRGDLLDPRVVAAAVRSRARTRPGPRRPRRCWPRRRRAGSRWSAPGGPPG